VFPPGGFLPGGFPPGGGVFPSNRFPGASSQMQMMILIQMQMMLMMQMLMLQQRGAFQNPFLSHGPMW
jgi:hypothetical protein